MCSLTSAETERYEDLVVAAEQTAKTHTHTY
jgi:hypothetical protein